MIKQYSPTVSHGQVEQSATHIRCVLPIDIIDNAHTPAVGKVQLVLMQDTREGPDFRNAAVTLSIRGNDFKPNGSQLYWWSQAESLTKRANWMLNSFPMNQYLLDNKWHKVQFILHNDEDKWIYCGSNPSDKETGPKRYKFISLDKVLGCHNLNFIFVLAPVDPHNLPTGSIDFKDVRTIYKG